jgi:hypothetical protein
MSMLSSFPVKVDNNGTAVTMKIQVAHGVPSITKSIAQITNPLNDTVFSSDIPAGTTIRWRINPVD